MQFEVQNFVVRDQRMNQPLKLAAWWIPNPSGGDRTVVLIHGYADAKVGAIAWAPTWRELGYHILAIDMRAHGESDGKYTTAGVFERFDLDQVLNELKAHRPQQTQQIILFGVSLGTCTALAVAQMRDDIAALVLECPVASFAHSVERHAKLLALPLPSMLPAVMWIAQRISGADLTEVQPLELMASVKCPILVIQSEQDQYITSEDIASIGSALQCRNVDQGLAEYWHLPDTTHVMALAADPDEYAHRVGDFLRKASGEVASRRQDALS
jgi:pimeloyl-ACP methyl ester carboxylesterase